VQLYLCLIHDAVTGGEILTNLFFALQGAKRRRSIATTSICNDAGRKKKEAKITSSGRAVYSFTSKNYGHEDQYHWSGDWRFDDRH
jgi:hypothetical protein